MAPDDGRFDEGLAPSVSRRILAARLREVRNQASLTLEGVATLMNVSTSKISRLETEDREPQVEDVRRLTQIYQLPQDEARELVDLAEFARRPSRWRAFPAIAPYKDYFELEAAASSVQGVDLLQIHGLLQTPDYARALLTPLDLGPARTAVEQVEQIVESRHLRQQRLLDPAGLEVHAVIGEAALETRIGSPEVMHEQTTHLLEMSRRPNITLQVLPFAAGSSVGQVGNFVILGFRVPQLHTVVYLEHLTGQIVLDRPADVGEYTDGFAATVLKALTPDDSRELLEMNQKRWNTA